MYMRDMQVYIASYRGHNRIGLLPAEMRGDKTRTSHLLAVLQKIKLD